MLEAPPHTVPAGPFAVRWHGWSPPAFAAGAVSAIPVELENAGTAPWRSAPGRGIHLAYHWLDLRGNPIVWAGSFVGLPSVVEPGERVAVEVRARAPIPPGRYRLALDLVDEGRAWFSELGNHRLEQDLDVGMRLPERTLSVQIAEGPEELVAETREALAAQEEPVAADGAARAHLAAGCRPAPDWSRRILDAHAEGYAAVGGSVEVERGRLGRAPRELDPWKPGFGRVPGWSHPLVCFSALTDVLPDPPWAEPVAGLPALDPEYLTEPWVCDGRIRLKIAARALLRADRRSG